MVKCGGLENRLARKGHGGSNPSSSASKLKTTLKLRRFFIRSKMANACLFYPSSIPTVRKTCCTNDRTLPPGGRDSEAAQDVSLLLAVTSTNSRQFGKVLLNGVV